MKKQQELRLEAPRVLKVPDLAAYLRVHQSTVYRLVRMRNLPAFRVGSDWRFNREEIDKWIAEESKMIRKVPGRRGRSKINGKS